MLSKKDIEAKLRKLSFLYCIQKEDITVFDDANLVCRGLLSECKRIHVFLNTNVYDRLKKRLEMRRSALNGNNECMVSDKEKDIIIHRQTNTYPEFYISEEINEFYFYSLESESSYRKIFTSNYNLKISRMIDKELL